MSEVKAACFPERWYHWYRFAVLPHIRTRKADEQNTWSCHFHWLVFRAWTMDSVSLSVELALDDLQFVARAHVPYLIFGIFVPLFPMSWSQKLWRKSRMHKRHIAERKKTSSLFR